MHEPPRFATAGTVRSNMPMISSRIRRDVVRYAHHITTTCGPDGIGRVKAIRVLCDWLAEHHPDVERLDNSATIT